MWERAGSCLTGITTITESAPNSTMEEERSPHYAHVFTIASSLKKAPKCGGQFIHLPQTLSPQLPASVFLKAREGAAPTHHAGKSRAENHLIGAGWAGCRLLGWEVQSTAL